MDETNANPLWVGLFFILRCLVPLVVMLVISYLFKRLGLIQPSSKPPAGWDNGHNEAENGNDTNSGSLSHGKA